MKIVVTRGAENILPIEQQGPVLGRMRLMTLITRAIFKWRMLDQQRLIFHHGLMTVQAERVSFCLQEHR